MSTEQIALRPVAGSSLSEVRALGQIFRASGYFKDIRDEAQAVTKILYGRELGFTPIVSIMGIYVIDGKPSLASNLLATLVKRSGKYDYRVKENTAEKCVILFRERIDTGWEDLGITEFTIEEAKQAGVLGKDNWRRYPKAMLFARALSSGVRAHCPDVSMCPLYTPEELGAEVNEEGEVKELPASERPTIEIIKEPITFKKSAPANPGQDGSTTSKGQSLEVPSEGADPHSIPNPLSQEEVAALHAEFEKENPMVQYITSGQQRNFHKECRAAVRPARSMDADNLTYQWLLENGYKKDGQPTAAMIPAAGWLEVRHKAVAWLRVQ